MSDPCPNVCLNDETLDDKLACLSHELDLSLQWKRPSLLFAIYDSDEVRTLAQTSLESLVKGSGQKVVYYPIQYGQNIDLNLLLEEIAQNANDIFYMYPERKNGNKSQTDNLISMLNSCRGWLVDRLVRVVFWLTEEEALKVAHQAPDFWASRHRVIEFFDNLIGSPAPAPENNTKAHPVSANPQKAVLPVVLENDMQMESQLVIDFSEEDEPSFSGINLLLMLGVANWKEGNREKALEPLQAALAIAEKSGNKAHEAMCHKAIALVKSDCGQTEDAIKSYQTVIALEPANGTIWNNLGALNLKAGKFEDAIKAYQSVLQLDPNDQVGWHGMGNAQAGAGRLDEAINCYRKAIQFNSGYIAPWIQLANVLSKQNRFDDALYAYMRIVEMDNKNVHAWSEIGSIYLKAGSYEQSIDAYKKALKLGDATPGIYKNLATANVEAGYFSEAIPLFQKAIDLEDDHAERAILCNSLGDVYRRVGDYESAVGLYEKADNNSLTLAELAGRSADVDSEMALQAAGSAAKPASAIGPSLGEDAHISESLESLHPGSSSPAGEESQSAASVNLKDGGLDISVDQHQNADLLARLAEMYIKIGAADKAIEAYLKVVDLQPGHAKTLFELGQLYIQKSDLTKAISYIKLSLEAPSSSVDKVKSLNLIGDLYRQQQDYSNAMDSYWAAFGIDQNNKVVMENLGKVQAELDQVIKQETGSASGTNPARTPMSVQPSNLSGATASLGTPVKQNQEPVSPSSKLNLNNPDILNEIGNYYARSNLFEGAVEAYQKAIALNPDFGWSYSNLASVLANQGRFDEAVTLFEKSVELLRTDVDKAVVWNRMADLFRQAGQYPKAIEAYQNADKLNHKPEAVSGLQDVNSEQLFSHFVS